MKKIFTFLTPIGIFLFASILMASSCQKEVPKKTCWDGSTIPVTQNCPAPPPAPSINSFTVTALGVNTAELSFSVSNYTALSISIDGGAATTVTGSTFQVTGLASGVNHTAVLTATNLVSGVSKTATKSLSFITQTSTSGWLKIKSVTYGTQSAMIGNTCSDTLTIVINNSSSGSKTFNSLLASFGSSGQGVKNIRYLLNGSTTWSMVNVSAGIATFSNITLQAGDNTFKCIFALMANQSGIANGSALAFRFTDVDDGTGPVQPIGGFPAPVAVGTINSATQPTIITTEWNGQITNATTVLGPGIITIDNSMHIILNIRATGPAPARLAETRLKNPYTAFTGIVFDNNGWKASLNGSPEKSVLNYIWQNEFITLTLPNVNSIITDGVTYNRYVVSSSFKNNGNITFNSGDYTPGKFGFLLTSKYDLKIYNSDNQLIDLSDNVIKQDGVVLNN